MHNFMCLLYKEAQHTQSQHNRKHEVTVSSNVIVHKNEVFAMHRQRYPMKHIGFHTVQSLRNASRALRHMAQWFSKAEPGVILISRFHPGPNIFRKRSLMMSTIINR